MPSMKCWSFNGPKPGGPESKKQKEADIPWFTWKAKRVLFLRARAAADRHQRDVGTREREREGIESKGVLINMVWAYILSYKVVILSKDKD